MIKYTHDNLMHNDTLNAIMNEEDSLDSFKVLLQRFLSKTEFKQYGKSTEEK